MIINSGQKDVEVLCIALVTYQLTIIYETNDPSAKYVNLKKNLIIRRFGRSPSSGMVVFCTWIINFVDYCKFRSNLVMISRTQPRTKGRLRASVSILVSEVYPGTGVIFVGVFSDADNTFRGSNTTLFIVISPFHFLERWESILPSHHC